MKIIIDARHVRDFGIGTYILNLIHALGQVDRENRYILVRASSDESQFQDLPANFETATYERRDDDPRDHISFPLFLRRFSADLVHIPLNRVPWWMPRPYVVTIHDMSSLLFYERMGPRQAFLRYVFRRGLLRAERVIVVSSATRKDVENLLGVPSTRIRLVYNAPNPEFFRRTNLDRGAEEAAAERERILERYQIHYPFLLYAGSIRPQKNVPRLVEAFAVAREELERHPEYADLRLIIIGDELSQYPSARRAVMQSRVENVVRFLGFVPFETLRVFYEAATAFVFPSLYEGFGLPPVEAMACGTPVITSTTSSLPEVVGQAAMLVNPENVFDIARGIKEVLLRPGLRAELSQRGREHARRFSWENTAREVLGIYREAVRT